MNWRENKLVPIIAGILAVIAVLTLIIPILLRATKENKEMREGYEKFKAHHQFDEHGNVTGPKEYGGEENE